MIRGFVCQFAAASITVAATVPEGTQLQLRLRQAVSSFGSEQGSEVVAEVIAPFEKDGAILIPLGARVWGRIEDSRRVGLGLVHESAWIHLTFDDLALPNGQRVALTGRISEVDNARETIDAQGRIRGIRATASFSSVLSSVAVSAASLDPMLLAFGLTASLSAFRIPESEIYFPPGTELHFQLTAPVEIAAPSPASVPSLDADRSRWDAISAQVRALPFRTATQTTNTPSDLTNLVFIGSREAIERSFDAAGWAQTDARNARSVYGTLRSIVENQGYREAPMSTLVLNGAEPTFTYAKTLNTFFKRHHLRIFAQPDNSLGQPLWTSSSTHDSGIGFATGQKTFIHIIDQNIDEERDKVANDLMLTGCVQSMAYIDRPWVPRDAFNSTGDALKTDDRAAVLQFNDCTAPRRADDPLLPELAPDRPNVSKRIARNTMLTLRNDLIRGNIFYQGYEGVRLGIRAARKPAPEAPPRAVNIGGQPFQIVPGAEAHRSKLAPDHSYDPSPTFQPHPAQPKTYETFLEFSVSAGYLRFANDRFSQQNLQVSLPLEGGGTLPIPLRLPTELRPGWNLAANVTFNAHRHFSHELGFTTNKTKLRVGVDSSLIPPEYLVGDAQIRQFHYALLIHPVPNGARLRPFVAIGPGLQLIRLVENTQSGSSLLKFAFREVNALYSAYRFGGDPPLEGGGIFLPTLHYGGGVKFHWTRRIVLRADYRETLSAQPDFWTKSHPSFRAAKLDNSATIEPTTLERFGKLRQQRISLGIGVTF